MKKDKIQKLGNLLREEREKRNLLLREASALLEIDQAILSKIERNDRRATKQQIIKFSNVYEINKDELLIAWLSDKVANELFEEAIAKEVLIVAEQKINYQRKKNDGNK